MLQCGSNWEVWLPSKPLWKVLLMRQASLFMCHMCWRQTDTHTHKILPCSTPFCSLVSIRFFSSNFSWQPPHPLSFLTFLLCHPRCSSHLCVTVHFSPFPARWTEQRDWEREGVGDKHQIVQFLLGGLCPSCLLTACHNSSLQCKR